MELYSKILAGMATATIFLVYLFYFLQVRKGTSKPNPATWLIWLMVMVINAFTYTFIVGDLYKALIAITASIMIGFTMVYALLNGRFGKLGQMEQITLIACIIIGVFWRLGGDTSVAHLLLQVILLVSFIPTLVGLLKKTLTERPLPWLLAVMAYVFQMSALIIVWDGNWISLVYPFVNGILGNGSVALLAIKLNKS
ncbi:MAG: hypothetical protein ACKKL6_04140 [Candidatus Komeilibacteria bacterium]